ncbi:MAG: hypothetical protein LBT01_01775 [Spirochaetaceae bacterium]|jgi:hypothetical protein|nr:hypothetical protein [Spirochaetaceae bacterium]
MKKKFMLFFAALTRHGTCLSSSNCEHRSHGQKAPVALALTLLVVLFAINVGAVFAQSSLEGAWKQELMGSAWGVWAFNGNNYVYYIMDVSDSPDEAGTFTVKGKNLILQPTQKLTLDGKYASYTREFDLKPRGILMVANTKGKLSEYKTFKFNFPALGKAPPPKNDRHPSYPNSLVGAYYVDAADGKKVTLEFTKNDTLELLGKLTCVYDYNASTGKGTIYDPASKARKTWGTFSLSTASGSMMTLVLDGKDVPMKETDKPRNGRR